MVVEQFPMFRLMTLLARQLSSPIATRIKTYATTHPRVREQVIARVGRWYHIAELRFKMWTLRLKQPDHMPRLSEAQAVQSGANIMGEMVIFGLGSAIIIFEVNRQADKQEMKVLDEQSEWVAVLVGLEELQRELALQQQDLDRLWATLNTLAPGALSPPPPPPPLPPLPETKIDTKPQEPVSSKTTLAVDSTLKQSIEESVADSGPIQPAEKSTLTPLGQKSVVDVTPKPPMQKSTESSQPIPLPPALNSTAIPPMQKSAADLTPKPSPPALKSTLTLPMQKSTENPKEIPPSPTSAKDCIPTPPPTVPSVDCITKSPPAAPAMECILTPPPDEDCTPAPSPPDLAAECIPP